MLLLLQHFCFRSKMNEKIFSIYAFAAPTFCKLSALAYP